jgi:hypothetical protein
VDKGYYTNMPIQKSEQLTVQTGKPPAINALGIIYIYVYIYICMYIHIYVYTYIT